MLLKWATLPWSIEIGEHKADKWVSVAQYQILIKSAADWWKIRRVAPLWQRYSKAEE